MKKECENCYYSKIIVIENRGIKERKLRRTRVKYGKAFFVSDPFLRKLYENSM